MNFKYWRKRRKLTRIQLATIIGTSKNYIYEIETDRRFPSGKMLNKITNALNICIIIRDASECKKCKCKKCPQRKKEINEVLED